MQWGNITVECPVTRVHQTTGARARSLDQPASINTRFSSVDDPHVRLDARSAISLSNGTMKRQWSVVNLIGRREWCN